VQRSEIQDYRLGQKEQILREKGGVMMCWSEVADSVVEYVEPDLVMVRPELDC
jgi:hypothetical protein